ncbi:M15 family metallopeptidase [Paenibacillus sp. HN-1]|uniref:M15 family metallopeptidase n=1 Tax=Paenibacillus TaxID=44249 RepID=UPI001CA9F806|nr:MULTISPECIES: M15 family metallopeptidase [Paenibacillus]MBY9078764.1 M15 family metallopeptidase [Paenibacillus sp. CGMCC 1.18879]MBY9088076.1 M15 family metallopeptidase [Paenibacillus sinensis]
MKKWVFWLVILLLLGVEAILQEFGGEDHHPGATDLRQEVSSSKDDILISMTKEQIYIGNLLLVNKEHSVHPQGVTSDVVNLFQHKELVKGYGLLNNTIRLSQSVAEQFESMIGAAKKDGVSHFMISSGYRDTSEQRLLYREKGADYALPAGHSEHNLGLSLDIGSTKGEMNDAPEGKWLEQHAWEYGFVLRYPKDKAAITGIQYEPWHFRYVGLPHSVIMRENDFTLEQYVEYLRENKTLESTVNGEKYEIAYYPVGKKTAIPVPANRRYEISGNNVDGVIVTVLP